MTLPVHAFQARDVTIPVGPDQLDGDLTLVPDARGLVVFVHGSGSSRLSARNRGVARELNRAGLATLLFDLLTPDEEEVDRETSEFRFDIPLLAKRLERTADWVTRQPELDGLPLGYFGASTGAAAALIAAADRPEKVAAVVSRGGRPDLAGDDLERVEAPTLLIVGGADAPVVLDLNRSAHDRLKCQKKLEIIPGAGHLFEERGKLEEVARLTSQWFAHFLEPGPGPNDAIH